MIHFNIEAIRADIRVMDYVRGTPAEVARWNEADENARANLAIEDMEFTPNEAALFKLFRDEAVPPALAVQIGLKLLKGSRDALIEEARIAFEARTRCSP